MKNLLKLICFLFLCFSCQEQEVVSGMQANSGVLNQDFYSKLNFLEKTVPSDENQIVSIVLSNTGNYPISDLVIEKLPSPVSFYGDIYPGTGGDCSDVIQSESSCTLVFEVDLEHEVQEKTHIFVKYHNGVPVIKEISRVSKPGRRIYTKAVSIPKVQNGLGIAIVSTSKGIMTDNDARSKKIGGEIICKVF